MSRIRAMPKYSLPQDYRHDLDRSYAMTKQKGNRTCGVHTLQYLYHDNVRIHMYPTPKKEIKKRTLIYHKTSKQS